ncbi:Odorant receptor 410, partial [Nylanderia fulva]
TCFKKIEGDWLSLNTEIEKTISQRHTKYGQSMTKIYSVFIFFAGLSHLLKPVIMVLVRKWYRKYNKSSSSKLSSLPYNVEYAMYSHFIIIVAVDSLFYTVIQHICRIYILENIGKNDETNFHLDIKKIQDDNYDIALNCLRRHLHVSDHFFNNSFNSFSIFLHGFFLTIVYVVAVGKLSNPTYRYLFASQQRQYIWR